MADRATSAIMDSVSASTSTEASLARSLPLIVVLFERADLLVDFPAPLDEALTEPVAFSTPLLKLIEPPLADSELRDRPEC